jgi:hypothetical protein
MRRLSTSRNFRVSRLAPSRCVFSSYKSLRLAARRHPSMELVTFDQLFLSHRWPMCSLATYLLRQQTHPLLN